MSAGSSASCASFQRVPGGAEIKGPQDPYNRVARPSQPSRNPSACSSCAQNFTFWTTEWREIAGEESLIRAPQEIPDLSEAPTELPWLRARGWCRRPACPPTPALRTCAQGIVCVCARARAHARERACMFGAYCDCLCACACEYVVCIHNILFTYRSESTICL